MQKVAPLLAVILLLGIVSIPAYADYTPWIGLRIPYEVPNICVFEAEDPKVDFHKRDLYNKTVNWIQTGWIDQLNKYTGTNNWDVTYEYIENATHYDKKATDFPQCHVLIVFDAENKNTNKLANAQGWTSFDYKSSSHKFAFIDIYTWSPTTEISLGPIDIGKLKQNPDGSYDIPIGNLTREYQPTSNEAIRITVQHEFGHALGLGHWQNTHVNDFNSLMAPSFEATADESYLKGIRVTLDDLKATVELYGIEGFKEYNTNPIPEYAYGWVESVNKGTNQETGVYEIKFPTIWLDPLFGGK